MKAALLSILTPLAMAQSLCGQFDYHSQDGYYVNNNAWGKDAGTGSQCTTIDEISDIGVKWHTDWNWSGGDYNVKAYPYSGRELYDKKLVSDINGIPTKAEWNYGGDNIRANVAYDLFTAADPGHDISSGDYEIMIWLGNLGGVHPIGDSQGNVGVGGQDWELFVGFNGAMKVFSFVAPEPVKTFEEDLRPFFDHITSSQDFPANDQHLITLQFGTEPFTGANGKFDVYYWYGDVN